MTSFGQTDSVVAIKGRHADSVLTTTVEQTDSALASLEPATERFPDQGLPFRHLNSELGSEERASTGRYS